MEQNTPPQDSGTNAPATENTGINDATAPDTGVTDTPDASSIEPPPAVTTVATPPPEAPAAKQVEATPPPAPAPVSVTKPVVQEAEVAVEGGITKYADINRVIASVPKAKHAIIHFLTEYAADMAPRRPIPETTGAVYQADLYRALHNLINKEDEHFKPLFTAVLVLGLWRPPGWLPVIGILAAALAVALTLWQAARRGHF